MGEAIKYVSRIEINGLWGKYDLVWDLNKDVNVLSGINGSGKSTILNCVYSLINRLSLDDETSYIDKLGKLICNCKMWFGDNDFVYFDFAKKSNKDSIEQQARINEIVNKNSYVNFNYIGNYIGFGNSFELYKVYFSAIRLIYDWEFFFQIDLISTFDIALKPAESIKKLSDDSGKTGLDWEIYQLQKKYIKYKLNLANKTIEAIGKNITNGGLIKIQENQNRFLEIIDTLFEETGKKVDRKEDELTFLSGEAKLNVYQLSSGEKQLLVILLTVLVQDNKNAILFMDEPEISLHFDWQKKLIGYITELNPNVQIILATHSPAMIMEGWRDKVANVSDLIHPSSKPEANAAK